jgi:hypothetical protein
MDHQQMKKNLDPLKTLLLLFLVIVAVKMIAALPWWSFVIPVILLGMFITARKWKVRTFTTGFLAGFLLWAGANLYFHLSFSGIILGRIEAGPRVLVLLLSGVVGGLLTGFALYTGRSMMQDRKAELKL